MQADLNAFLHCNIVPIEYGVVPEKFEITTSPKASALALDQREPKQERNGNV